MLANLEQQALFNAMNWSVGVLADTYGSRANSTVSVTRTERVPLPVGHAPVVSDGAGEPHR